MSSSLCSGLPPVGQLSFGLPIRQGARREQHVRASTGTELPQLASACAQIVGDPACGEGVNSASTSRNSCSSARIPGETRGRAHDPGHPDEIRDREGSGVSGRITALADAFGGPFGHPACATSETLSLRGRCAASSRAARALSAT